MVLKIGIVEDELIIAESIRMTLEILGYEVPEPAGNFEDAIEMIEAQKPDLIFLDINLKGNRDGIDLAKIIKDKYGSPFIFLTANADSSTINRAKETNPAAYLLKPFQKEELFASIEVAMSNHALKSTSPSSGSVNKTGIPNAIFIKDGYYFHKVLIDDIVYLESDDVYVNVVTKDGKRILVRTSLKQYYTEHFDTGIFYRVSRSHIINLKYLDGINSSYVVIRGQQIPIGKNYRDALLSNLGING